MKMKKVTAIIIGILMVLSMFSPNAFAANSENSEPGGAIVNSTKNSTDANNSEEEKQQMKITRELNRQESLVH